MPIKQSEKELIQHGWPTGLSLKDFNRGMAMGTLFCLLFWAGTIEFVFKSF